MAYNSSILAIRAARPSLASACSRQTRRCFATSFPVTSATKSHKVVVIGGGSAGLSISHQLLRSGRFSKDDIAIVDPANSHDYQPGWTLVGGGLKSKEAFRKPLQGLIDPKLKFYNAAVETLSPEQEFLSLTSGNRLSYEQLVVAPGIKIDYGSIQGLPEALADPDSGVSSIYGYDTCDNVFPQIQKHKRGVAIFTQPSGIIKCAGAPQKAMWLALDYWKREGLYNSNKPASGPIQITFATGLPAMFGVPKYSAVLDKLREQRNVEGLFQHDLVAINGDEATFARNTGAHMEQVVRKFDFLHAVPKMGPHEFIKRSILANEAGYVNVNSSTLRHVNFRNVWSAGDAAGLPTSKTAAAITSQAPVLVANLLQALQGREPDRTYDGYTSCPLLTEYGKVLLAEFKYGGEPKETFGPWPGLSQDTPRRAFYHLKKDFFPWVYEKFMIKGTWAGPSGWIR